MSCSVNAIINNDKIGVPRVVQVVLNMAAKILTQPTNREEIYNHCFQHSGTIIYKKMRRKKPRKKREREREGVWYFSSYSSINVLVPYIAFLGYIIQPLLNNK